MSSFQVPNRDDLISLIGNIVPRAIIVLKHRSVSVTVYADAPYQTELVEMLHNAMPLTVKHEVLTLSPLGSPKGILLIDED